MTIGDAAGTVTVCSRGRSGLYADYRGLIVRNFPGRPRRLTWAEISRFDDGTTGGGDSELQWELIIVLHAGETVRVTCTAATEGSPDTLTAVRQVAERHGIPADLTGVAMRDGLPPEKGRVYEDPAGGVGVRYWDGVQWSPLLPNGSQGFLQPPRKSAARWAELPVSPQPWRYAAVRAARLRAFFAISVALTAALAVAWLAGPWRHDLSEGAFAGYGLLEFCLALSSLLSWFGWSSYRSLDRAANDSHGTGK